MQGFVLIGREAVVGAAFVPLEDVRDLKRLAQPDDPFRL
jgi:hypothetical protein